MIGFKFRRKLHVNIRIYLAHLCTRHASQDVVRTPYRILFFGNDEFSLASLVRLHQHRMHHNPSSLAVVTSFKQPPNSVRNYAAKHALPCLRWPVEPTDCEGYQLGVVVSFGHLLPASIIESFPFGILNVHGSLLPRYRGAAPIIHAMLNGDQTTGISIMKIAPRRFDVGEILAQREIAIPDGIFMPELRSMLAENGAELLLETIFDLPARLKTAYAQQQEAVSYAPKITEAQLHVNWSALTANEIYRKYRALFGHKPLITGFQGKRLELLELRMPNEAEKCSSSKSSQQPGSFAYSWRQKLITVCCADGSYLELTKLRLTGRKLMTAADFYNGYLHNKPKETYLFVNEL